MKKSVFLIEGLMDLVEEFEEDLKSKGMEVVNVDKFDDVVIAYFGSFKVNFYDIDLLTLNDIFGNEYIFKSKESLLKFI